MIEELVRPIRRYDLRFDSTKELLQLVKPIINLESSDTGVVEELSEKSTPDHLRTVTDPLIQHLDAPAAH